MFVGEKKDIKTLQANLTQAYAHIIKLEGVNTDVQHLRAELNKAVLQKDESRQCYLQELSKTKIQTIQVDLLTA